MKLIPPNKIETQRLRIRRHTPEDLESFTAFMTDLELTQYLLFSDEDRTDEGARRILDQTIKSYTGAEPIFALAIAERETDRYIGTCGLGYSDQPDAVELFYSIIRAEQGKGFATEAARALLEYAWQVSDASAITAFIMPENEASAAVVRHLGFADVAPMVSHGRYGRRFQLDL